MAYNRRKRKVKKNIPEAQAHIHSTYNNTVVSITDKDGNVNRNATVKYNEQNGSFEVNMDNSKEESTETVKITVVFPADTIYKENAVVQYDDENNEYFYPGDKDNGYENMRNYLKWVQNILEGIEDKELDRKVKKYFL